MRRRLRSRWHDQDGQGLLETALMIPLIFTVVFWVFELSWLMFTYVVLANAAHEGVRYSIVHSGGDAAGTQTTVQAFASTSLHNISAMSTSVTFPDGSAAPCESQRGKLSTSWGRDSESPPGHPHVRSRDRSPFRTLQVLRSRALIPE